MAGQIDWVAEVVQRVELSLQKLRSYRGRTLRFGDRLPVELGQKALEFEVLVRQLEELRKGGGNAVG